nr:hypothetical protein [Psychrobacter sp. PraFG1]UNK05105.1 hypothetical protein MN210_14005 [Psychrobacter sp. PraFG1]
MLSGSYALGVAVAYGILGAIIAIFGQQLGIIGWLQNPVILLVLPQYLYYLPCICLMS